VLCDEYRQAENRLLSIPFRLVRAMLAQECGDLFLAMLLGVL
jgi:hypothetical protein